MGKPSKSASSRDPVDLPLPEVIPPQPLSPTELGTNISTSPKSPTRIHNSTLTAQLSSNGVQQDENISWRSPEDIWPLDGEISARFREEEEESKGLGLDVETLVTPTGNECARKLTMGFLGDSLALESLLAESSNGAESLAKLAKMEEIKEGKKVVGLEFLVKIYVLGKWRWVVVDGLLPVSNESNCLFPYIQAGSGILFWPAVLFKIHLYLASLGLNSEKRTVYQWAAGFILAHAASSSFDNKKLLCAVADLDWKRLQPPKEEGFRFASKEEYEAWVEELEGEDQKKAWEAAAESEEKGMMPVNVLEYEAAQNDVIAYQESVESLLKAPQQRRCVVQIERAFSCEVLTLKKKEQTTDFKALHYGPLDRFQEKVLHFHSDTRYLIAESCLSPFKGSFVRLDGALLAEDESYHADTEQTFWMNTSKLEALVQENSAAVLDLLDTTTFSYKEQVSFQLEDDPVRSMSVNNFISAVYLPRTEVKQEEEIEAMQESTVVMAFEASPIDAEPCVKIEESSLPPKDPLVDHMKPATELSLHETLVEARLQRGMPYSLLPSIPHVGVLQFLSSEPLRTGSLAHAWFECNKETDDLDWFEATGPTNPVLSGIAKCSLVFVWNQGLKERMLWLVAIGLYMIHA